VYDQQCLSTFRNQVELLVGTRARRFRFVEEIYSGAVPAISCDGLVPGAALDLTHWQRNRTPRRFKADTSTEIALKFVASAEASAEWANAVVVNNHFDTDGLLSIWILLEPERASAHRALLIAGAEAGDFDEWPAIEKGLWLDAAIRALSRDAGDDAGAYERVLPELPDLIRDLDKREDLWGEEWGKLQSAVAAHASGAIRAARLGGIGILVHEAGQSEAPGALLAREFLPGARRYLLAFDRGEGTYQYRYERPRYAWADTVVRPALSAPDAAALASALGPGWTDTGLPGLTGIARTRRALRVEPEALGRELLELDPSSSEAGQVSRPPGT
jgi:hypothetical protein